MANKDFKVIIVGGSIAGLSLALMLERNGIDYLVLEGYPSIAPQVGASIGLLPNGLRTLDQLGCGDKVIEMAEYPVKKVYFRDSRGQSFWSFDNFDEKLIQNHGYPVIFFDRQMLIQILYDKIQDKSKILTSQRVATVQQSPSSATVITENGRSFTGDMVVGADGIHSKVRQQMWQEAQKADPTWIDPTEEQALPATYACIFGISKGVEGVEKGTLTSVFNEHFSYLVPSGPGDRTYWFLVRNLGKTVYGSDIPRFTKEEEEALAKEHMDDHITPTLRFSDLYNKKIASVYTSLPEYVYKRWYFKRIITIGDASHKLEPLTGQGGNSAIETAAALTNNLVTALQGSSGRHLSAEEISQIFADVQRERADRVWSLVKEAHVRQRVECMDSPLLKYAVKYLAPYYPEWLVMYRWTQTFSPAPALKMLPQPNRKHTVPFHDELLRSPRARGSLGTALYAVYLLFAFIAFRLLLLAGKENGTWSLLREAITDQLIPDSNIQLRQRYTGIAAIDTKIKILVAIFYPAVTGATGPEQPLQLLYFLSAMLPMVAVITIEGFRPRHKWTLLAYPGIWGILYQLRGIGLIAPLYFLVSTFASRSFSYFSPATRTIPTSTSKVFLPALMIGYIIPTTMLLLPIGGQEIRQAVLALWQPAPVYVSLLTLFFSKAIETTKRFQRKGLSESIKDVDGDSHHLKIVYKVTGMMSACFHVSIILSCIISTELSLPRVFVPRDSFAPVARIGDGVFIFFQNDFLMMAVSTLLWCWASMWDLYRVGMSDVSPITAAGIILVLGVMVGPGATVAVVWFWREHAMTGALINHR